MEVSGAAPAKSMVEKEFVLERRHQRRPPASAIAPLPWNLSDQVRAGLTELRRLYSQHDGAFPTAVVQSVDSLLAGTTPEQHLRAVSQIVGAITEWDLKRRSATSVDGEKQPRCSGSATPKEPPRDAAGLPAPSAAVDSFVHILSNTLVFPFLLDCRVRYAHRPLVSLLKLLCGIDGTLPAALKDAFLRTHLRSWDVPPLAQCLSSTTRTSTVPPQIEFLPHAKEEVMHFVNCLDALTVTVVPLHRSIFAETFLVILPLLSSALQWCVDNVLAHQKSSAAGAEVVAEDTVEQQQSRPPGCVVSPEGTESPSVPAGVYGEDLECLRFCGRVVATHIHKFLDQLSDVWVVGSKEEQTLATHCLGALLRSSSLMLSSMALPKDVLNAAGLLTATILTVSRLDGVLLDAVCRICCGATEAVHALKEVAPSSATVTFDEVERVMQLVCSPQPVAAESCVDVLRPVFGGFTRNGCFAFLKGLLAHVSSPIRGDSRSVLLLLQDHGAGENSTYTCTVHSVIMPTAMRYSTMVQEPDTRFMAIQAVDGVIRHISSALTTIASVLEAAAAAEVSCGTDGEPKVACSSWTGNAGSLPPHVANFFGQSSELPKPCRATPELQETINSAVQLVMGLWDDVTQQISGPLYETYHHILRVNTVMARCHAAFYALTHRSEVSTLPVHGIPGGKLSFAGVIDAEDALLTVLRISNSRRGKYHALGALGKVLPLPVFVRVVDQHFAGVSARHHCAPGPADAAPGLGSGLSCYVEMLLGAANNPKVNSIAGEVLAQLVGATAQLVATPCELGSDGDAAARKLKKGKTPKESLPSAAAAGSGLMKECSSHDSSNARALAPQWLYGCIIDRLCQAIVVPGSVEISANVSLSHALSNIMGHMVMPWIRDHQKLMHYLLEQVVANTAAAAASSGNDGASIVDARVRQGVVEILYRARNVGVDVSAYLQPGAQAFQLVLRSLTSLNDDLRNTALGLCILSPKKAVRVAAWQCDVVEMYVSLHMNLGGNTTARKNLVETFRKWVRRLSDSTMRVLQGTPIGSGGPCKHGSKVTNAVEPQDLVRPAGEDDLEYTRSVLAHISRLARVLVPHVGESVALAALLSTERRLTALVCYDALVRQMLPRILAAPSESLASVIVKVAGAPGDAAMLASVVPRELAEDMMGVVRELLPQTVVPGLLAALSDGWDKMREAAQRALLLFCEFAPNAVFASVEEARCQADAAYRQLASATFRTSQGAVQRYVLAMLATPHASVLQQGGPAAILSWCDAKIEELAGELTARVCEMQRVGYTGACKEMQVRPVHGLVSLCGALHAVAAGMRGPSSNVAPSSGGRGGEAHVRISNILLAACTKVVSTCSLLVGGGGGGVAGGDCSSSTEVDCRGHVFRRSAPEALLSQDGAEDSGTALGGEAEMRTVVNNTWLGIRTSTAVVEQVVRLATVEQLSIDVVRQTCYTLVEALLQTKHNGVMRTVRQALNVLVAALVRSRTKACYDIPHELVQYLLGPRGVTSPDVARVLRRSQGLPHALVAVLEAEDASVPLHLFPLAMNHLLHIAGGRAQVCSGAIGEGELSTQELHRGHRVNALNMLKFLFDDKAFSGRSVAFIQEAFTLATEGFNDGSWAVRNSSLILFSSVLHRFVGEHPSTGGAGVNTTLYDIAIRTPRGVAFAHRELQDFLHRTAGISDSRSGCGVLSTGGVDPGLGLFPILQMLSMLCPNPTHLISHVVNGSDDDLVLMKDAVSRCRSVSNLMVRSASASALAAIVPGSDALSTLTTATTALAVPTCSLDEAHGVVLQLQRFFAVYVGTLRRDTKKPPLAPQTAHYGRLLSRHVTQLLLEHSEVLGRMSAACTTIATALFALVADVLHHEAAFLANESGYKADSTDAKALLQLALTMARTASVVMSAWLAAPTQGIARADRAHAANALALLFLMSLDSVCRLKLEPTPGAETPAGQLLWLLRQCLQADLEALKRRETLRSHATEPVSVSLFLLEHCCTYTQSDHKSEPALAVSETRSILALLENATDDDVPRGWPRICLVNAALGATVSMVRDASTATPGQRILTARNFLELATCLRFLYTFAGDEAFAANGCDEAILHIAAVAEVRAGGPKWEVDEVGGNGTMLYSEARGWAMRCLGRCALATAPSLLHGDATRVPERSEKMLLCVVEAARKYSHPQVCVSSRLAAVDLVYVALHLLRHPGVCKFSVQIPSLARLELVLLRVIFDDAAEVRERACAVTTHLLGDTHIAPTSAAVSSEVPQLLDAECGVVWCQSMCVFQLVRHLRRFRPTESAAESPSDEARGPCVSADDVAAYFFDDADAEDDGVVGAEDLEEEGEEGNDLFEKESANMYAEVAFMRYITTLILPSPGGALANQPQVEVPQFPLLTALVDKSSGTRIATDPFHITGMAQSI